MCRPSSRPSAGTTPPPVRASRWETGAHFTTIHVESRRSHAQVGLDELIRSLPDGYETTLGRMFGDVSLSGGQWQMFAIARAFARPTPLMILDEPTSSLDPEAEFEVFERFKELATRPGNPAHLASLLHPRSGRPDHRAERRSGRGAGDPRGAPCARRHLRPPPPALPDQRRDRSVGVRAESGGESLPQLSRRGAAGPRRKAPKSCHDPRRVTGLECSGDVALGRLVSAGPDLGCCQVETVQREALTRASVELVCAIGGKVRASAFARGDQIEDLVHHPKQGDRSPPCRRGR